MLFTKTKIEAASKFLTRSLFINTLHWVLNKHGHMFIDVMTDSAKNKVI
jgi:hypothetical protein